MSTLCSSPDWLNGLILYEIVPEQFTEEGTFNGIKNKMPYLHDLGITGIWITPINPSKVHFYNIKSGYACIDPSEINPDYGTPEEFKDMIDEAHKYGIKVIIDVVTHGVTNDSPLIKKHPNWFKGNGTIGSWRMIDYNWDAHIESLDEWWVSTWTNYVLQYGVDGYRLDVDPYRKDLWEKIKFNCAINGKHIVLIPENFKYDPENYVPNGIVYDTAQHTIDFKDIIGSNIESDITRLIDPGYDFSGNKIELPGNDNREIKYNTFQLSCHDTGWSDLDENVYKMNRSRYRFGYWLMFGPWIPVFMSGEEFDNVYSPKNGLIGHGCNPESIPSNWLYGSKLNWDLLQDPERRKVFADCKKIISTRKQEKDIFENFPMFFKNTKIKGIEYKCDKILPIPYIRWNRDKAIIVVGNHLKKTDEKVKLKINLDDIELKRANSYKITNLWTNECKQIKKEELMSFKCSVKRDNFSIYKIEPI